MHQPSAYASAICNLLFQVMGAVGGLGWSGQYQHLHIEICTCPSRVFLLMAQLQYQNDQSGCNRILGHLGMTHLEEQN